MILSHSSFQYKILILLLLLPPLDIVGQAGNKISLQESDTSKAGFEVSRHSLFAGAGYGSNMIYLGSTISQDHPYGYNSLTYSFKNEFYATVSAVHLSRLNPFMAFYIGSLNYNHVFNSWFDISAGAYRYQVVPSLTDTLFRNFTYSDMTLGFDWRLIYSKVSVGGLFSDENRIYFQLKNSRYFQTPDFFMNKVNLSFDPNVNLLFGTLIKAETTNETSVTISPPYRKWKKNKPGTVNTTYSRTFGIMELDFGLPVDLNTDFMTIEAEPSYVLPFYDDTDYPGKKGFIFLITVFFRIF
jgi:hypothetical protein